MKERPILFKGPLVRAILAGEKTQTRRLSETLDVANPFGAAGDRLWIKETWRPVPCTGGGHSPDSGDICVTYAADGKERYFREGDMPAEWTLPKAADRGNVTPLFMPRWVSRITLQLVDVRRELLHDITDADIRAEGVTQDSVAELLGHAVTPAALVPRDLWKLGWNFINGKRAGARWEDNPLVWVLSFRRITEKLNAA